MWCWRGAWQLVTSLSEVCLEPACKNSQGEDSSCGMISPAAFTFCKSVSCSNGDVDKNRLTAADCKNSEEDHCAVNLYFHHT